MLHYVNRLNRVSAYQAYGIAVIIDVVRAFTVAPWVFSSGADSLWLVQDPREALALRKIYPDLLLIGEVDGHLIPGFDLNNSPAVIKAADLRGKRVVQSTGAGTRTALLTKNAQVILLCSLTNARATAIYARQRAEPPSWQKVITLIPSGEPTDFVHGNEDVLCADYVEATIRQHPTKHPTPAEILGRGIAALRASNRFDLWKQNDPDLPIADIDMVLHPNIFNCALVGTRKRIWENTITYLDVRWVDVWSAWEGFSTSPGFWEAQ
jgi:2-phosphosulfolactate phosphatase